MPDDTQTQRLDFPATGRNRDAIFDVVAPRLEGVRRVLEVASGSGQHAAHFASRLPHVTWLPSDPDPTHRASIAAWTGGIDNVAPPLDLDTARDVAAPPADIDGVDAVLCCNMIHIAPWAAGLGLLALAGLVLRPGGLLFLYGPFMRAGRHTSESNARFDESLRQRDPDWGVRNLYDVAAAAEPHGLALDGTVSMPANNLTVIFRRQE